MRCFHPSFLSLLMVVAAGSAVGCGKKKSSSSSATNLPLVSPPVKAAVPTSLQDSTTLALSLPAADFKTRFFITGTGSGPTDVFNILASVDNQISGINTQTAGDSNLACVSQTPVSYTITPFGQSVAMYAQCSQTISSPTDGTTDGFMQFGVNAGVTYIYSKGTAESVAIIATPGAGVASASNYAVQVWIALGDNNNNTSWDSGGYGAMQLTADQSKATIEFTAAGTGFGYCGVQMRTDGTMIYAKGSLDQGGCQPVDTICVEASDAQTTGTCGTSVTSFIQTALGREASKGSMTNGASLYPTTPNIILNGTTSDSTGFGPTSATAGVGTIGT